MKATDSIVTAGSDRLGFSLRVPSATALGAVFLVVNLVFAGGVRAGLSGSSVLPFKGNSSPWNYQTATGCSKAGVVVPAFFNLSSGVGGFRDNASASSCRSSPSTNGSAAEGGFKATIDIPYHPGSFRVFVNFSESMFGNVRLSPGNCTLVSGFSYCIWVAAVYLHFHGFIVDLTTGKRVSTGTHYFGVGRFDSNTTVCSPACSSVLYGKAGPVATLGAFSWSFSLISKMQKSDSYALRLFVSGGALVYLYSYNHVVSGTTGAASIDFGAMGHGLTLKSIVES
jgi:hypothetical protein